MYIYIYTRTQMHKKSKYRKRKYASTRVLVRKCRGQFASLRGISQRRASRGQTFISMRLFPFSPVAVAKDRHRGSEGRICTLSRICTLPSSPKLLRTLFAVLAGPEWRVNGGYLEAERHVHSVERKRRTEMEKSGEERGARNSRIHEFDPLHGTEAACKTCETATRRERLLLRDTNANSGSRIEEKYTHDSLDTSSRSWTLGILGRYIGVMMARKGTSRIKIKVYNNSLLHAQIHVE